MKKIILSILFCFLICLCACQVPTQQNNENTQDSIEESSHTTAAPSENDTPKDDEETVLDWKTAYLDYVEKRETQYGKESAYGFDFYYALVYVDNDDIPELYAMGAYEADGDLICSYKNGRIIEQGLARTRGGKYVERSGVFVNQNGKQGHYYSIVYQLDETGFSPILNASYTERYVPLENDPLEGVPPEGDEYEIIKEYFIDDKSVTKDEYDAAINAYVDLSQTVKFYENSVSYDIIKQQIADCK